MTVNQRHIVEALSKIYVALSDSSVFTEHYIAYLNVHECKRVINRFFREIEIFYTIKYNEASLKLMADAVWKIIMNFIAV